MPLSPLATPPTPPNGDSRRAAFLWDKTKMDSQSEQQAIINFCGSNGCDTLFLDAWGWIGGSSWNASALQTFIKALKDSGIKVYALWGAVDWGTNQAWVQPNIIRKYDNFQALGTAEQQFDGMIFDVEYWTDEGTYPASTNLPGLLNLVKACKQRGIVTGLFAGFFLKDNSSSRPSVSYNGKSAQDGEHMMDVADFIVVGSYRDHADDGGAESGPGQKSLMQPWIDYASPAAKCLLYSGSETINVSPAYVTYFGASKSSMEAEHTKVSDAFTAAANSVFAGQAVHDFAGWSAMS